MRLSTGRQNVFCQPLPVCHGCRSDWEYWGAGLRSFLVLGLYLSLCLVLASYFLLMAGLGGVGDFVGVMWGGTDIFC